VNPAFMVRLASPPRVPSKSPAATPISRGGTSLDRRTLSQRLVLRLWGFSQWRSMMPRFSPMVTA
jgi:hypothetical protein